MLFDCKASLVLPNCTAQFKRAKIAIGGHNGVHYILVSLPSSKEKLCIANVSSIHQNKKAVSCSSSHYLSPPELILNVSNTYQSYVFSIDFSYFNFFETK